MATYSNNTLGPIGTFSKMLKAVKDSLRWTCVGVVLGSRIADYGLDYPFPMGNVSSHTYTYAGKRSFACNCEENNGKCGLAPPNNRFERTHGTSPFAAQPNVIWTPALGRFRRRKNEKGVRYFKFFAFIYALFMCFNTNIKFKSFCYIC